MGAGLSPELGSIRGVTTKKEEISLADMEDREEEVWTGDKEEEGEVLREGSWLEMERERERRKGKDSRADIRFGCGFLNNCIGV